MVSTSVCIYCTSHLASSTLLYYKKFWVNMLVLLFTCIHASLPPDSQPLQHTGQRTKAAGKGVGFSSIRRMMSIQWVNSTLLKNCKFSPGQLTPVKVTIHLGHKSSAIANSHIYFTNHHIAANSIHPSPTSHPCRYH